MHLSDLWFIAIAVLWAGYFVLEGFDFGVGILLPFLSRDDMDRRVMINTIGPVWDGNEVWLLTAGGATFAAFPPWYAAMFSSFYLPLLIILIALIIRGVAFEYRGKRDGARWRVRWDAAIFLCSLVPALLWGVAFGNIVRGIPLNAAEHFTGNFWTFLNPYALLGGVTTLALFTLHGALFLALKTTGELRNRANATASAVAVAAIVAGAGFLAWTGASYRAPASYGGAASATRIASVLLAALAAVALIGAALANRRGREGVAFAANAVGILAAVGSLFTALYPRVLPSTTSPAYSLTTANAAAAANTLAIMTVVACIFLPLVLAYQAWTYWVFRKRVSAPPLVPPRSFPPPPASPPASPPPSPSSAPPSPPLPGSPGPRPAPGTS
jgi:cytochrome bd ubiquinol oxidase subunit II